MSINHNKEQIGKRTIAITEGSGIVHAAVLFVSTAHQFVPPAQICNQCGPPVDQTTEICAVDFARSHEGQNPAGDHMAAVLLVSAVIHLLRSL